MFVITIKFRVLRKSTINFVFPVFLEGVLLILDIRLLITFCLSHKVWSSVWQFSVNNFVLLPLINSWYLLTWLLNNVCTAFNKIVLTFKFCTICLKMVIAASWILALILQLREYGKKVVDNSCVYVWSEEFVNSFSLMWHSFVFVSCIILAGLYSRVVHTLWFRQDYHNDIPHNQQVWIKRDDWKFSSVPAQHDDLDTWYSV